MADVVGDFIARLRARLGAGDSFSVTDLEREIRDEWGGGWVYVSRRATHEGRDAAIVAALKSGLTTKQVSDAFGVSERHVRRIKRTFWG